MFVLLWPWLASCERYLCCRRLRIDPAIGFFQAFAQGTGGRPSNFLADEPIIRIATADTEWTRDVANGQLLPCDVRYHSGELVDRDHLVRADVDRSSKVRINKTTNPLETFVDVQKRAGLFTVTPDFNLAAVRRFGDF